MTDGVLTAAEIELLPPWAQRMYRYAVKMGREEALLLYYEMVQSIKESRRLRDEKLRR